jgi:hypothetical protein
MKNALVVILILISTQTALAENQDVAADLQKVCNADIQLLDKQYTESPDSTLIPDVKRILKLVNQRNRLRSACKAVTQDRMPARLQASQGN